MMGICSSCFGKSNKYLGQSPKENSFLDPDAEKLIPKEKIEKIVVEEPAKETEKKEDDDGKERLIKAEGGDSGTFDDELSETNCVSPGVCGEACAEPEEEVEEPQEQDEPEPGEPDPVQLTVSSMGSGFVLEKVPETAEHDTDEGDEGGEGEECENAPLITDTSLTVVNKPTPKLRHHSFGSRTILGANPLEGRKQFVIHKVNSKSLLNSGIKYDGSRQSSRNSSISGPSKSSLPPSRGSSRPTSRPPSRSSSRAPSPDKELVQEIKPAEKPKPRFSIIGVDGPGPQKKISSERGNREKSPGVSFAEAEEVFDFEERQYQTVHAGCEIKVKPSFRDRTRSGRLSRGKSGSGSGSRPSIIDWPMGKFSWLKDRQKTGSKLAVSKPETPKQDGAAVDDEVTKGLNDSDLSPKTRPRSTSDKFNRPPSKKVVDVYKQAAFDWPLGQIGKIKQKYQKSKSTSRSKSDANLTDVRKWKRRGSERGGKSRKVAFEDQQSVPWWNYPMKLMKNRTSASTGNIRRTKKRRRHSTDPESRGRGGIEPEARRRASSLSTPHRASDVQVGPEHSAILFRDARGLPVSDPFLTFFNFQSIKHDETQIFVKFFGFHKCYDLIPTSAKLVVFDTQLLVKKAFFALVYNGVRAAPLWDSVKQRFVGMLTITDFIRILEMNYRSPTLEMEELEEHRLSTWRNVLHDAKELIYIHPDASLYDAIKTLIHNKIHRLPVIDALTGNVLYILTHKRILRFLFLYIEDLPDCTVLDKSIRELDIGTYTDIEVAHEDTRIIEALHKFVNKRVSALPIVDDQHRLIDIYAKFDVINLAAEKTYSNLDVTLKEANKHRNEWFEGVHKCRETETLFDVMDKIVKAEVHRLVIVDDDNVVCGVISLSDILSYLVLRPGGDEFANAKVKDFKVSEISGTDISDPSGAEEASVPSSQPGGEEISVSSSAPGTEDISVPSSPPGTEEISVPSSQPGPEDISVPSSPPGTEEISVPSSPPGTEEISVPSSQPGTEEITVPSSQSGTEEITVPSSQSGTPKVSVSELPEKLVEETEPSSLISYDNSHLSEPSGGKENSTAVESETSVGVESLVNGIAFESPVIESDDKPSEGESKEFLLIVGEAPNLTDESSAVEADESSEVEAETSAEDTAPLHIKQSNPENIQELPSKLMNGDQTISLPNSEKTKDLLKSDSTDSAFEATEELVESDIPVEGRVHLQILDPTNQQFIETNFEPEKSGKMLEDCDNLGMEKLNGLSSPGHKDISIQ